MSSVNYSGRGGRRPRLGLRGRLLIATTAVLGMTLGAGFAWAHFNLWAVLLERVDRFLVNKAQELADVAQRAGSTTTLRQEIEREIEVYESDRLTVCVQSPDGSRIIAPNRAGASDRDDEFPGLGTAPRTLTSFDRNESIRGLRTTFALALDQQWELDLTISLAPAETTLAQFDRRVAVGGLAFLVLALPGGFFLYRLALRPVTAAVRAARKIDPADLKARLPRTGANDELDHLSETINDLLQRLATFHARIAQFTADASHELRTPLATMRAVIEVALGRPRDAAEYVDVLASLNETCERMTHVINGLQTLAQADAGRLVVENKPVDLAALAAACVELLAPLAEDRGVDLATSELAGDAIVMGDGVQLHRVVMNLLDNALKFTRRGGMVRVAARRTADGVALEVADTGIGVPAHAIPHLGQRFYRVDAARTTEGTGLGLSICRMIIEAHGGRFQIESVLGQGSCFRVLLPSAASASDHKATAAQAAEPTANDPRLHNERIRR